VLLNYFRAEKQLLDYLALRVGNCTTIGVGDYYDVLRLSPEVTKLRGECGVGALFVFYGDENVKDKFGCGTSEQNWNIAVCTKNVCDLKHMQKARHENGEVVYAVLIAMQELAQKDLKGMWKRINAPQFPIADKLGVVTTMLSFQTTVSY
jgi:hypothetical protein